MFIVFVFVSFIVLTSGSPDEAEPEAAMMKAMRCRRALGLRLFKRFRRPTVVYLGFRV
jgi:hypothetical protein